jgi:hypothetical protein
LHTALEDIKLAQEIEAKLLDLKIQNADDISETGDARTSKSHFVLIAESYRLSALLQLYQTFPDLVERRLPKGTQDATEFIWNKWMVPLSLQLITTLKKIPTTSGTQCIQPILYITASTGLRFDKDTLTQRRLFAMEEEEDAASVPQMQMPSFPDAGPPSSDITELSIEVTHGRRFIMERLSTLEHSLAPAPIRVAKDLVEATWAKYDGEAPGMYNVHWVDVMEESGLRTIFG